MKHFLLKLVLLLTLILVVGGCNSSQAEVEPTAIVPERPYIIEGELLSSPSVLNWIDSAVDDLSQETGVEVSEIAFTQFDLVVWPDSSYGCPSHFDEDIVFDPSIKEGYKIHLRANGRVYFYHGGEGIEQFLCTELE